MLAERPRRRSVGFLEKDGESWACFLVTFWGDDGRWHGYFSFRPNHGDMEEDDVRTADIFLEGSESEIDQKARGLGRPLLSGLLASALHTSDREADGSPRLRVRFRKMLSENSRELRNGCEPQDPDDHRPSQRRPASEESEAGIDQLRSLYESYRLDQVAHFISLVRPEAFQNAVDTILDGRSIDFGGKDRLQFAMIVVEHIESLLPLPSFEVWAEDYLAHRETYRVYAHTLHREGRLP